ncbi:pentatricopeptide repeat-containing protein [Dorcoceras hygrometricum]|uniref:Pentatricopeptide repeat-containing protein n=1 Tax=Dorcoceras hygrometricum TaxID=472368 RepID=A0A2Z7AZE2_9LAMI|nr:pentatricopeptide repeat-containing protein [Dorcoceras hygrometricum]
MRRITLIFPKTVRNPHFSIDFNNVSSTQKLQFSVSSNGQNIERQNAMHLLQNPERIRFLDEAKSLHAVAITMGPMPMQEAVFVNNRIISMYVSLGDTLMARALFDEMTQKNAVSYNTMIGSYSRDGFLLEAWELLSEMRKCDLKPTQFTFGSLLTSHSLDVLQGMQLQALMQKIGLLCAEPFAGTALLGMYGRNGCLQEAIAVFECMPQKNLVTWNNMISVFGQMGFSEYCMFMLCEMMQSRMELSPYTFVNVLSCFQDGDMQLGRQIHGIVIKHGFDTVVSVSNCLISMYQFGDTCLAVKMFEEASVRDIVSWNTLILAMESCGRPSKALDIFLEMCATGLLPNETTFVNVVSSCSRLQASSFGELIHAKMIKRRFESSVYSGTSLVDFYAKRDKMEEAHICFDGITQKNLVSWNSLIMGYSNRGSFVAVRLLREMIHIGYQPNESLFSIVVKSSLPLELLQLHSVIIKMGYQENDYALSSLISSYARNGLVSDALNFFEPDNTTLPVASSNTIAWIYNRTGQYGKTQELYATMQDPDTISWNILIAACSRNGDYSEAFELFHHMRNSRVFPDNYTYVSLFNICTKLCNFALGSSLHGIIMKTDFTLCDTFLCNVMVDMYGKCGSLESSVAIFNDMVERNVISWTALISALGQHGYANGALERFEEMKRNGFKPDKVAFLAVFSACRHVGFVREGMSLFDEMKSKYHVEPEMDHYLLIVDLLAKHGHLKEAEKLILGMPIPPNALIWRSFLEGCKKQTNMGGLDVAV